ncbi:EAL domain-containing protein [Desulfobaculum bizertense]|uniref:EAL domain-containing protein n=1 Tax=Desulfobaculum bizertense TaxID=376490 RepID=UPI001F290251|nr:EAL domain-containing protein [Desulfobaculum bizertense]UIJ37620.1 EAL domain-containing protein [Desulfobaculum bizertense]
MNKPRLFTRIFLLLLIGMGIWVIVLSSYTLWREKNRQILSLQEKGLLLAQSMALDKLQRLESADQKYLNELLAKYVSLRGIDYLLLIDGTNSIRAQAFSSALPFPAQWLIRNVTHGTSSTYSVIDGGENDILQLAWPLPSSTGTLLIGMSMMPIHDFLTRSLSHIQALSLIFFAILGAAGYYLSRSVTAPISELIEFSHRVANHDFTAKLNADPTSQDEISVLSRVAFRTVCEVKNHIVMLEKKLSAATQENEQSLQQLYTIVHSMPDALIVCAQDGTILRANKTCLRLFSLSAEGVLLKNISDFLDSSLEKLLTSFGTTLSELVQHSDEYPKTAELTLRQDGLSIPISLSMNAVMRKDENYCILILRDISDCKLMETQLREIGQKLELRVADRTERLEHVIAQLRAEMEERKRVEQALRAAEADYRSIFENTIEGIFRMSDDGHFTDANPALAKMFGFEQPREILDALRSGNFTLIPPVDFDRVLQHLSQHDELHNYELRSHKKDGTSVWLSLNARRVLDKDRQLLHLEGSLDDITKRIKSEEELRHRAFHDPLTALPNRDFFQSHLQKALNRFQRNREYKSAVLYLDLDRFKLINDSLGHSTGDQLLRHTSSILQNCVRNMDTVARFGGDEFAVLLEGFHAPRECITVAKRILKEIEKPVVIDGCEVFTSASIGIVIVTDEYCSPDAVLRDADTAMYRAKEMGRSRFKVFNQKMHDQAMRQLMLETDIRHSLSAGNFELYYQPILALSTGKPVALEALIRWNHPDMGLVLPSEFISIAEETGLILPLGEWVMREACSQVAAWRKEFNLSIPVSINLSARQFLKPSLVHDVRNILEETGTPPSLVTFEITESVLMKNTSAATEMLNLFKKMGITISMDDFGTGYSSFTYLTSFPIDILKIDQRFIARLEHEKHCRSIVKTLIRLAQNLGLLVVAEGVATPEQAQILASFDCPYAQGFLYSRPLPAQQIETLIGQPLLARAE